MFRIGFGFPGFMFAAMLLRFLIAAIIIVFIGRRFKRAGGCRNNALRLLDYKFANGEITEEEYMKRKTLLTQQEC
jgi:putative membrane protein